MKLIIAEKHSVGQNIAKVLGSGKAQDGYIECGNALVTWCVGHLVGLSLPDSYGEEYENYWTFDNLPIIPQKWKFAIDSSKRKQYGVIKNLLSDNRIDEVVCATDAGREGECIFRYVYNMTGCTKPVTRLWISSMEDTAIRQGLSDLKPDSNYDNLFMAGLSRAKADWLVGMNGSRLFSNRYGTTLNIGRVQTPVLAMVVKRDYDVKNFIKQKYFTVALDCKKYIASSARIDDENTANAIAAKCMNKTATVADVKKEVKTVNPPKLYDLTTLQREANRQFGYTAKQTLEYTQSLYEAKLVTYPRTDSQYITDDMEQTVYDMVDTVIQTIPAFKAASMPVPNVKRCVNNAKVSDHTAIIPTSEISGKNLNELPTGERNILLLIAAKLLTATAEPHKYEATKVTVQCENYDFFASGKTIIQNGFKELEKHCKTVISGKANTAEEKENMLPEISVGDIYENVSAETAEHWTSPPKPYTEDTLLKAMETAGNDDYDENSDVEKKGLGTPATRADIIENLVKRSYIERSNKSISATEKGVSLIDVVPDEVKSAKLTADWETVLQDIEKGKSSAESFMTEIENFVKTLTTKYAEKVDGNFSSGKASLGICPRCGKNIIEGKINFYCESGKDGCGFTIWKNDKFLKADINAAAVKKFLSVGKAQLKAVSKEGKEYTATFEMIDTGKYVNFRYCKALPFAKCPLCGKAVYSNEKVYNCENKDCDFKIWKTICDKSITEAQAKKLMENRKTDLIKGFTNNKSGKKFDAHLVIKPDGTLGFEFPKKD